MIELENISKTFKVSKREAGLKNAVKSFLKRDYEEVHALNDVSFKIDDGEMVGYIGPNGAGKSTTIKIMCGILTPDEGKCKINGYVPYKDREKYVRDIGAVFGNRSSLWWDVPVVDSFEMNKAIYNIPDDVYQEQKAMLTKMLNIEEIIKKPTRTLSLGQRMRCEIAIAFLHKPKIVFLDEPTIGLDSVSKIAVRKFIKEINKKGYFYKYSPNKLNEHLQKYQKELNQQKGWNDNYSYNSWHWRYQSHGKKNNTSWKRQSLKRL